VVWYPSTIGPRNVCTFARLSGTISGLANAYHRQGDTVTQKNIRLQSSIGTVSSEPSASNDFLILFSRRLLHVVN
jgi:hypothetical protein